MPQPKKGPRFGGSPSHHKHISANLATELFRHGRIETTWAKAKDVQPLAERMVTFAKRGDLHARRRVQRVIRDRDVVHKLFADVGPAFAARNGGYTRVLKTGPRKGDRAPMALLELVEATDGGTDVDLSEAPRRRWSLRRRRGTVSQSAQQREEELAAAVDRGEDTEEGVAEEPDEESAGMTAIAGEPATEAAAEPDEVRDAEAGEEPTDEASADAEADEEGGARGDA